MTTKKFLSKEGLAQVIGKINEKLNTKADKSELQNISSGGGKKFARIVIGISTAGYSAGEVDYLCDGTDDQEEINQAINSLPENGGKIVLLDGLYNITSSINIANKNNILVSGSGKSTQLKRVWDSSTLEGVFMITNSSGINLSDLYINNNDDTFESENNRDIHYDEPSGKDLILNNLYGIENKGGSSFGMLGKLQRAVRNGNAKDLFPIGTIIPDIWTDPQTGTIHQAPLIVVHYGDSEMADGTTKSGAYLIRQSVLPFTLQFDEKESGNPDNYRKAYGNNRYIQSNIHQYLNSNGLKNSWWSKTHQYDAAPDYAATRDGYLRGCSSEILAAISEVRISSQTANADSGLIDKVSGKFFLPSLENLNFVTGNSDRANSGVEGPVWDYYKTGSPTDGANSKRVFDFSGLSTSYVLLRSAYRSNSYNVHNVNSGGSRSNDFAYASYAVAPACFIC